MLNAGPVDVPPPKAPLSSDGGMSRVSRSSRRWSLLIDSGEGSLEGDRDASCQLMAGEGHLCSDHCHVLADGLTDEFHCEVVTGGHLTNQAFNKAPHSVKQIFPFLGQAWFRN
jgi:hypothetical protein